MLREKIIFLSNREPFTTKSWSGIPYFMYHGLQQHFEVVYVKSPELRRLKLLGYYINRLLTLIGFGKIFFDSGFIVAFITGIINTRTIRKHSNIKFIFCPSGITEVCFLKTNTPIVNCSDCSLLQMIGYYPALDKVMPFSRSIVRWLERKAFKKAQVNIFSSDWAADFVKREFSLSNVVVIPFGANLSEYHSFVDRHPTALNKCTLIFVGVDWHRKGGEIALKIRAELETLGIDSRLIIVGAVPLTIAGENIEVIRDLVKHEQEKQYAGLFQRADFMILPTLADCTPIVIAESFAFGVPVLATDTGGIKYMIDEGRNGFLINGRSSSEFVKAIAGVLPDLNKRRDMARAGHTSYTEIFNWSKWSADVAGLTK